MKTAKEMFEELGYNQFKNAMFNSIEYINGNGDIITFWLNIEQFSIPAYYLFGTRHLKAINQQAKELGWLDE